MSAVCSVCLMLLSMSGASSLPRGSTTLSSGALSIDIDTGGTGDYAMSVDGSKWFLSQPIQFSAGGKTFSTKDGSLVLSSPASRGTGSDPAGEFDAVTMNWLSNTKDHFVTTIKAYKNNRSQIVFQSAWPQGATGTVGSSFPSFLKASSDLVLGALEYTGSSCGFMVASHDDVSKITGGKSKGMIAVVPADTTGQGTPASLVVGPVTEHFVNQASPLAGGFGYGMASSFTAAPVGYTIETVVAATSVSTPSAGDRMPERSSMPAGGANAALAEYGDYLLARHDKTRAGPNHTNEVAHIGYSTTGFYFYNMCDCLDPDMTHQSLSCKNPSASLPGCKTYQDTLVAVYDKLVEMNIPVKHFLLDSWWYGEGVNGGAYLWEDVQQCVGNSSTHASNAFPRSLKSFYEHIGSDKTLWAHNGKWVSDTPYIEQYPFSGTIPQGPELWRHLFKANKQWGLNTIKQDHIGEQMGGSQESWTNVSVLKSWLSGMGEGAAENDANVLYCCAPPNIHMNGVTVPSAFAVRASPDYVVGGPPHPLNLPTIQWAIGPDSAFHWNGLGLLPYKDTFFSNTSEMTQSNNSRFVDFQESNPLTHALMSTLSMAPVTFSDGIGMTNKTLVMMICRSDGIILKPDRPATAIDAQFNAMMFGAWPGPLPPPPPSPSPPPAITLKLCNKSDPRQLWTTGNLSDHSYFGIAADKSDAKTISGCMDLGGCKSTAGSSIHMFWNNCGCGTVSECQGKNELWQMKDNRIESIFAPNMCLNVSTDMPATLQPCDQVPLLFKTPTADPFLLEYSDSMCLHGEEIKDHPAIHCNHETFNGATTDRDYYLPDDFQATEWEKHGFSHNYAGALKISEELLHRIEAREKEGGGECCMSPQGPLGEVYSTHTTIGNSTWYYVVGVQLSKDFAVTPSMINSGKEASMVQFAWSDASAFKQTKTFRPSPFTESTPIQLSASAKFLSRWNGPVDQYDARIQYHTVAPELKGGWVLLGESNKLVPVSNQRISSIEALQGSMKVNIMGQSGEEVEVGVYHPLYGIIYSSCSINPNGVATIVFP